MAQLIIYATSNAAQTGVVVYDQTDWDLVGGSIEDLTSIVIELYSASLVTPEHTYVLSPAQIEEYKANSEIEISFLELAGAININDGWWSLRMTASAGGYISNYSGFGIYADITYAVFSQINGMHVPEEIKYSAEKYCTYAIFLKGINYLDSTNVVSREIKFNKRLIALQKMLIRI